MQERFERPNRPAATPERDLVVEALHDGEHRDALLPVAREQSAKRKYRMEHDPRDGA